MVAKKSVLAAYTTLRRAIERGKIDPVYILTGETQYLKDEIVHLLESSVLTPGFEMMDREVLHGDEIDGGEIARRAQTPPMASSHRLVLVRSAHRLKSDSSKTLENYLEHPSTGTVLVLVVGASQRARGRGKAEPSWLRSKAAARWTHEFGGMNEEGVVGWLSSRLGAEGAKADSQALSLFIEVVGTDLQLLATESDKLLTYLGDRKEVSEEDIRLVLGASRVDSIFDLRNAVGTRDVTKALESLDNLLLQWGTQPSQIIWMLSSYVLNLYMIRTLESKGFTLGEIAQKLKINLYYLRVNDQPQSKKRNSEEYRRCFALLCNAEKRLKSGGVTDSRILLETLVYDLCKCEAN
jgi:DNA polymerase-3 subunit delta